VHVKREEMLGTVFSVLSEERRWYPSLKTAREPIRSLEFAVGSRYQKNGEETANWEDLKLS
jgi:hypothetical protein